MTVGRPPFEINKEIIDKVEEFAANGLTSEQIADALGISTTTLCDKKNKYPELVKAIKEGKARGIGKIANALFENAQSGNTVAQLFYLKCKAGWREDQKSDMEKMLVDFVFNKIAPMLGKGDLPYAKETEEFHTESD